MTGLPAGWAEARLGTLLLEARSGFASGDDLDDGVFQVRMNNVRADGRWDLSKRRRVGADGKKLAAFSLTEGDVLFNATNSAEMVGKAAHMSGFDEPAVFSNHFVRVRTQPSALDPKYLTRWLNLQFAKRVFEHGARRWVNQATFDKPSLLALRIPVPPIEEQRRIAAVLDRADELRAKRRAAIALLDTLTESIFLDMFGAQPTGTTTALGDHLEFLTSGSRGWARFYADSGSPFLRIQNVLRDEIDLKDLAYVAAPDNAEARRTKTTAGDVLMSITADLGRTAVVPESLSGAFINQHLVLMRSRTLEPRYLSAFLTSQNAVAQIVRKNRAAVKAGLNFDDVRSLQIPDAPRSVQAEFAHRAGLVDDSRRQVRAEQRQIDEMFASLQQRAFRGEL